MKLSEKWLREWSNPAIDAQQLVEQLTMAGLEVESYLSVAPPFNQVVVGFVKSAKPHPNANKLTVCEVQINQSEQVQIVCGAANARSELKVAVALPGAILPNGMTIAERELRGILSTGMLCAATELGLGEESNGIMELPSDAPVGVALRDYLQLDDAVFDISITANRGDCLSVLGIAREVAALNNLTPPKIKAQSVKPLLDDEQNVRIEAPEGCPHYAGRIIKNINLNATTPIWMQERLRRSGIRSVSVPVDVTNYVLLELGQPMHAFDLNRLKGDIVVRWAKPNEKLVLLDGKEIELTEEVLTIADDSGAIALAGIMGGQLTAIDNETKDIFLESAFFTPFSVANRARKYGLQTDGVQRFERGVDPTIQRLAIERATSLILEIAGGQAGPINEIGNTASDFVPRKITLRKARLSKILGIVLDSGIIANILNHLGLSNVEKEEVWEVAIPAFRFDLFSEEDLIEEVARIYGYQNIPIKAPSSSLQVICHASLNDSTNLLRDILIDRGYHEAITYSFVDPNVHELFSPASHQMTLLNPISQEMSTMRKSLWPGLLHAVRYNLARQQQRVRFFEIGLGFFDTGEKLEQVPLIAGMVCGTVFPLQWQTTGNKPIDFFDIKGDVEQLLRAVGLAEKVLYKPVYNHQALYPGQSAEIWLGTQLIGYVGMLHPLILQKADIKQPVGLFEIYLDQLRTREAVKLKEISSFPSIRRDLALLVSSEVPVATLCAIIKSLGEELLQDVIVFDVYEGKGVPEGVKSVALALFLQHASRTLTDEEVQEFIDKVLMTLQNEVQARLRE